MKTNGNIISQYSLNSISAYWLFNNGKYIYCEKYSHEAAVLPTISIKYKGILEEHGIPYRQISDTALEFWDKDSYEEVDITLPTFIPWANGYRQIKRYNGSVITKETEEAAIELNANVVRPAIAELMRQNEMEKHELEVAHKREVFANMLVNTMGESNTAMIEDYSFFDSYLPSDGILNQNGKKLKVFNVCCLSHRWGNKLSTPYWVAFDMDNLPSNGFLELQVSEGVEGLIIGTDGWQVKKWAKDLGLRYIYVKTMK